MKRFVCVIINCITYCHHWQPQSQSSLLFCLLWSLLVVLDVAARLVEPSGFVVILRLLVAGASELLCADNLVPAGFSIDDFVGFCRNKFHIQTCKCVRRGSDITVICGHSTASMLRDNTEYCVKLSCEDLSRYSIKTESAGLRKCPHYHYLTKKMIDITITNISQSLPRIMAGKQRAQTWYEEIMSL